jgi:hypothetical protein
VAFNYYKQVNLQTPEIPQKMNGIYETLHFMGNKVEILDRQLRMIDLVEIYYVELVTEKGSLEGQNGWRWILIKGIDAANNVFNKKFLVFCNYQPYLGYFDRIRLRLIGYYNNRALFWQKNTSVKDEQLVSVGEIKITETKGLELVIKGKSFAVTKVNSSSRYLLNVTVNGESINLNLSYCDLSFYAKMTVIIKDLPLRRKIK